MTVRLRRRRLDVMALRAALAADPDTLLVDVRTPGEFRAASIDGAVNIPLDQLDAHLRRIVHDAGGRMVLVCQSGARAARAAEKLGRAGLTDVVVLEGGMNAWVAANAPVRRSPGAAWSLERQVRLVAGGIVASSVLASVRAPRLRFVAGAVGARSGHRGGDRHVRAGHAARAAAVEPQQWHRHRRRHRRRGGPPARLRPPFTPGGCAAVAPDGALMT